MSSSTFKVTESDYSDSITLVVSPGGTVTPDKETVQSYLRDRETADINLMRMKKLDAQSANVTLDTLHYINSSEIEDPEEMDELQRNLLVFRLDHDYTPLTSPRRHRPTSAAFLSTSTSVAPATTSHLPNDDDDDELAHTLSMLEDGSLNLNTPIQQPSVQPVVKETIKSPVIDPPPSTSSEPLTKITKIVKGKKQTMFVNSKQKAKMISTGLLKEKKVEVLDVKKVAGKKKVSVVPAVVPKDEDDEMLAEEEEEEEEFFDDFEDDLEEESDSDFELEQELKPVKRRSGRKLSENSKKKEKKKERIEAEVKEVKEVKVEMKKVVKKEKKVVKPPDDLALFSTPDIIRRVKESPTKPAKISPDNRSKSTTVEVKKPEEKKDRRLSLDIRKVSPLTTPLKLKPEEQVQVQEFSETLSNSNESITEDQLEPLPSAEDIRAIIHSENTKTFSKSLIIPDPIPILLVPKEESVEQPTEDVPAALTDASPSEAAISENPISTTSLTPSVAAEQSSAVSVSVSPLPTVSSISDDAQMNLESNGLTLDPSLLDNINSDMIPEDILYQVAQSLVDNTDLQNAIDKSIVEGNLVLDPALQESMNQSQELLTPTPILPDLNVASLMETEVNKITPLTPVSSQGGENSQSTHVVRPDGRVLVLPPIERPTTRSRNKKVEESSPVASANVAQLEPLPELNSSIEEEEDEEVADDEEEEEDDDDEESEDDPNKLWCICNQPHNNRFMICCDTCEEWYHGKCVNVTKAMGQMMEQEGKEWICVYCKDGNLRRPKAAARRIRKSSRASSESGVPVAKKSPGPSATSLSTSPAPQTSKSPKMKSITASAACIVCGKPSRNSSIYCSDVCILKHAQGVEKVVVFDRKSGKILSGNSAPSAANLEKWLADNPTYEVVRSAKQVMPKIPKRSLTQSKLKIVKNPGNGGVSLALQKKGTNIGILRHGPKQSTLPKMLQKKPLHSNIAGLKIVSKTALQHQQQQQNRIKVVPAAPLPAKGATSSTPNKPKVVQTKLNLPVVSAPSPVERTSREKPAQQPMPTKTPKERQAQVSAQPKQENLRETVRKTFLEQLSNRLRKDDDLKVSDDELKQISNEIESQLYKCFGDTGQKYRNKYRSLIFNIKDAKNQTLWRKICEKAINPYQLVRLSPDDLASQELALWREREAKHQLDMIKKSELELLNCSRQYVFKTHKGEQVFEDDRPKDQVTEIISGIGADSTSQEKDEAGSGSGGEKVDSKTKRGSKRNRRDRSKDRLRSRDRSKREKDGDKRSLRSSSSDRSERKKSTRGSTRHERRRSHSRDRERDRHRRNSHKSRTSSKHIKEEKSLATEKLDKKSKEILEQLVDKHIVPPLEDHLWKHVQEEPPKPPSMESDSDHEPSSTVTIPTPPRINESDDVQSKKPSTPPAPIISESEPEVKVEEPKSPSTVPSTPTDHIEKLEPIWKGTINMVDVAQIAITSYEVSGDCHGIGDELPHTLDIVGRISPETVWDYIGKMKSSNSKTISVIRLTPSTPDEKIPYLALYTYLSSRNRLGVVKTVNKAVKDFYILPLAGHTPIPDPLLPLSGPGFEDHRPALMIGVIVRDKRKRHGDNSLSSHSSHKRIRVDVVVAAAGAASQNTPPSSSRSYTPPPSRDPRIKSLPVPITEDDDDDDDMDIEDGDEPYSPEDSDPETMPEPGSSLNAADLTTLLAGSMKSSSFLESGLGSQTFEPFSNKFDSIPGLDTPALPADSTELQRKMAELDRRIALQKAEIDKVSQDLVSSATSDIPLANIALPSNLQQILESIKTIGGSKLEGLTADGNVQVMSRSELVSSVTSVSSYTPSQTNACIAGGTGGGGTAAPAGGDLTIPLMLPKLSSRPLIGTAAASASSSLAAMIGNANALFSAEDLIKKATEILGVHKKN